MQNESTGSTTVAEASLMSQAGKYLTFKLAAEEYGLEILSVKEIIGLMKITKLPRTPEYIRGVINLRGKVIPVMDLRQKFDMEPHEDTTETCIIVVEIAQADQSVFMGILVDSVSEVLDIAAGELGETPSFGVDVNTEFIQGMANTASSVIMLLDIKKIIGGSDLELSKKIAEKSAE